MTFRSLRVVRIVSTLDEILERPEVDVFESDVAVDAAGFERYRRTAEASENRAVSGLIRDDRDGLLLARYESDDRWDGWRLPGSEVGAVTDFESRLREELAGLLGDAVTGVEPNQVQKHTARREDARGGADDGEAVDGSVDTDEGDTRDDGGAGSRDATGSDREDREASLFYVLCDVDLDGRPADAVERASTPDGVELDWFAGTPDDAINEGVLRRLFGEK